MPFYLKDTHWYSVVDVEHLMNEKISLKSIKREYIMRIGERVFVNHNGLSNLIHSKVVKKSKVIKKLLGDLNRNIAAFRDLQGENRELKRTMDTLTFTSMTSDNIEKMDDKTKTKTCKINKIDASTQTDVMIADENAESNNCGTKHVKQTYLCIVRQSKTLSSLTGQRVNVENRLRHIRGEVVLKVCRSEPRMDWYNILDYAKDAKWQSVRFKNKIRFSDDVNLRDFIEFVKMML